jgi:natural product biosynthesis luciferase-like monooxygenase protein
MHFPVLLIGDESLTVHCGETLTSRGHEVRAVVTASAEVSAWAARHGLPVIEPGRLAEAVEGLEPFDYLLSAANLRMIPSEVLERARVLAINFHDGPLPRFAGLNAPAWAILEDAAEFGVTWHVMTEVADAGGILEQERFEIHDGETSVSLNIRCFEAGLKSFERLLSRLEAGDLATRDQDFSCRSYFAKNQRPPAASVIDPAGSVAEASRLIRALDFGNYANPLGRAKLATAAGAVAVRGAQAVGDATPGQPGRLWGPETSLRLDLADGIIELSGFETLDGAPLAPEEALRTLGLAGGGCIPALSEERRAQLTSLCDGSGKAEARYLGTMERALPLELPLPRAPARESAPATSSREMPLPEATDIELTAAFGVMLARLTGKAATFEVATADRARDLAGAEALFSAWVPMASSSRDCALALRSAEAALKAPPLAKDLRSRSPKLRGRALTGDLAAVAIGAVASDSRLDLVLIVDRRANCLRWTFDTARFDTTSVRALAGAYGQALVAVQGQHAPGHLASAQQLQALAGWNETQTDYPRHTTLAAEFERTVAEAPDRAALVASGQSYTYRELNERANRIAHRLRAAGVVSGSLVGVHLERSADMVAALWAVLKAGGAYVPIDPAYPAARKRLIIEDSGAKVVLADGALPGEVAIRGLTVVRPADAHAAADPGSDAPLVATADSLAYVIYTSGSTGRPKGVMVQQRNVLNFFAGMDQRLGPGRGTWLSVTSISFDISVLELLWTLTRGYTVVLAGATEAVEPPPSFSLFFFSSQEGEGRPAYELLMSAATFADEAGFEAVWTPERHFHAFGGAFPNASVTSAALAMVTKQIKIRAGSCVLPLHSPIRVAEEWAVVDNLSGGRVGISFAAGWRPDDFVLRPDAFKDGRAVMASEIPVVQALWRGETRAFPGPNGSPVQVQTLPRPLQKELPTWMTTAGDPETFRLAGRMGVNLLTHLLGQTVDDVAAKVALYREAWSDAGHPGRGQVTLMLHTYIGTDSAAVKEAVREPMISYLGSSVGLIKQFAESFPTFKHRAGSEGSGDLLSNLSEQELRELLEIAFERYYETSGLFGTVETAAEMVGRVHAGGVDEIACLVDFGLPAAEVEAGLRHLNALKDVVQPRRRSNLETVGELIEQHGVTHLQCTPSMAGLIMADPGNREAMKPLQALLVGGEALPGDLARDLQQAVGGRVLNMYGPTETTVWSTVHELDGESAAVPIGTPIANTSIYVLDAERAPLPPGFIGELWIGGEGVTPGYHGRPELTAERFLPDPFSADPAAKMYRTGDLARFREDGVIEFFGRVDQQVKVRGYRIEPGEIERNLREVPGVDDVVVIAREDQPGDQRLVAYYVSTGERDPGAEPLRKHVAAELPEHMVPTNFVRMDALPLTPNAKVDRNALPRPSAAVAPRVMAAAVAMQPTQMSAGGAAPDAGQLSLVASAWSDVLGSSDLPHERTFFDLGGNSLLLLQVHRKLVVHHPELRLTDLFKYPTIAALADHLSPAAGAAALPGGAVSRAAARRAAMGRRPAGIPG